MLFGRYYASLALLQLCCSSVAAVASLYAIRPLLRRVVSRYSAANKALIRQNLTLSSTRAALGLEATSV